MNREYHKWYSHRLNRDMELLVFGHAGAKVLVFPTRCGRFYEYENMGLAEVLRQRPDAGLLGGMLEVPSTAWADEAPPRDSAVRAAPVRADWWQVPGVVTHTFTHFRLDLVVYRAIVPVDAELTFWAEAERCRWVARRDLASAALPSVMRKIIASALTQQS